MAKRVTIHQPNYLPWIGFFHKASQVDCLVLLDTVQFSKNSYTNRARIKVSNGPAYLTVPVAHEFYGQRIQDVLLPKNEVWAKKHSRSISMNYGKTAHFSRYWEFLENTYSDLAASLSELNEGLIRFAMRELGIPTEVVRASDLAVDPTLSATDLLLALLQGVNASVYLSGPSGREYLQTEKFTDIQLEFHEFDHPVYAQRHGEFVKGLSAVDLLFNEGPEAKRFFSCANT